ncbi:YbaN family protein [Kineococcus sp. SYSU DK005]|uniref:hypothetical protein n=1 Tax=Kineococcus sp. SYSU DK005 TaxID=3383126 RepID=UPI003D7EAA49
MSRRTHASQHEVLGQLDPLHGGQHLVAGAEEPSAEQVHQAHQQLLALATAHPHPASVREGSAHQGSAQQGRHRWRVRSAGRWIAVGATAVALGIAAVVLPGLPGSTPPAAFASWTAVPAALAVSDVQAAGQACRRNHFGQPAEMAPMLPSDAQIQRMDTVLAEQRGAYTYTLLAGGGWLAECLSGDGLGGGVLASAGEVDLRTGWSLVPAPDGVVVLTGGTQRTGGGASATYRWLSGRVGEQVSAVEVTPTGEGVVTATVSNGYFAAWWPAGRSESAELTLRLADGEVVTGLPADPIVSRYEGGPG